MRTILSFRIGGVQEFIDAARTTDDFAISSYLVSHLAATSAAGVLARPGADLIFPARMVEAPRFPNGFLAIVTGDAHEIAKEVDRSFHEEWDRIYDTVRDIMPPSVRHHWRRRKVFETFWAVAPWTEGKKYHDVYGEVSSLIEARKTLRDFQGLVEVNIKCTQCGKYEALQEHEGYSWAKSREFSQHLADNQRYAHRFRPGEHLCPVCTTCRLARGTRFKSVLERGFPSTSSIAARPFVSYAKTKSAEFFEDLASFTTAVQRIYGHFGQTLPENPLECLEQMDGRWLYPETYQSERLFREYGIEVQQNDLDRARDLLLTLYKKLQTRPSSYIAVIVADGDKIGDAIARRATEEDGEKRHRALSESLANTADPIKRIVEQEMLGELVYAGGDDAVALAPAGSVVTGVGTLLRIMARELPEDVTVSVAALIVPHTDSLSGTIRQANRLLREEAKARYGRAHIVIAARRQSGQTTQAAIPWRAHTGESTLLAFQTILDAIDCGDLSPRFISRFGELSPGLQTMGFNELCDMAAYLMKRAMNPAAGDEKIAELDHSLRDFVSASRKGVESEFLLDALLTMRFLTRMEMIA